MAVLLIDTVASPLIDKTVLPYALRAPPEWARIPQSRFETGQTPRPGGLASAFVTFDPTPIPLPDAPGADVPPGAEGLPPRSALSSRDRMVVEASAVGDLALRTWVSSVLATTVAPVVLATSVRQAASTERDNLNFYAELAAEHDPVV